MLLERRGPLEQRVLGRAPSDASAVLYAELAPLRKSATLGRLVRRRLSAARGLAMVEPDVDALAFAVGADEIVGLAAGRFPTSLVQRYLEQNGASCPAALDEQACALTPEGTHNVVSIRALDAGLLGVTAGPRPDGADRLAQAATFGPELAARARTALDGGALVWVWIEPRRLAETMSEPPEGWVNLSLIARALLGAQDVSLSLRDGVNATVDATLEAECSSDADADELAKMLESLNGLGRTALRSSRSESSQAWAQALETGFSVRSDGEKAIARWQLPEALLEKAIAP